MREQENIKYVIREYNEQYCYEMQKLRLERQMF